MAQGFDKHILLVSATIIELKHIKEKYNLSFINNFASFNIENKTVDIIVTGIGAYFTVLGLQKINLKQYDLIINIGIAGDFTAKLDIGECVFVKRDRFADLGSLMNNVFNDAFEMNLLSKNDEVFDDGWIVSKANNIYNLKTVDAITVNTITNNETIIDYKIKKYNPIIETMEGAAFMHYCNTLNLNSIQIRAVSNYIFKNKEIIVEIEKSIIDLNNCVLNILALC